MHILRKNFKTFEKTLKDADGIVILLTDNYINSRFCINECVAITNYMRTLNNKFIFPVLINIGYEKLPLILREIQPLKISSNEVNYVIQKINALISTWLGKWESEKNEKNEEIKRIENNSAEYIEDELKVLKEKKNSKYAHICYVASYITLLLGLVLEYLILKANLKYFMILSGINVYMYLQKR